MAATTENQLLRREDGFKNSGPVAADAIIYTGTMVFFNATGYCTGDIGAGANLFAGVSDDYRNNTGGADGDIDVEFFERSSFRLQGAGFTAADVGKKVYATDNNTVSLTSTSNVYVGTIRKVHSATEVLVKLDTQAA